MGAEDPKPGDREELTGNASSTWASYQNEVSFLTGPDSSLCHPQLEYRWS